MFFSRWQTFEPDINGEKMWTRGKPYIILFVRVRILLSELFVSSITKMGSSLPFGRLYICNTILPGLSEMQVRFWAAVNVQNVAIMSQQLQYNSAIIVPHARTECHTLCSTAAGCSSSRGHALFVPVFEVLCELNRPKIDLVVQSHGDFRSRSYRNENIGWPLAYWIVFRKHYKNTAAFSHISLRGR